MRSIDLSQVEADNLIKTQKIRTTDRIYEFPLRGEKIEIPLKSFDKTEDFLLDINRSSINLTRVTYQNRVRKIIQLVRLDLHGRHRNPDGVEIVGSHVHIYKEGYGDKIAYLVEIGSFPNIDNEQLVLYDFMKYCNIIDEPKFKLILPTI